MRNRVVAMVMVIGACGAPGGAGSGDDGITDARGADGRMEDGSSRPGEVTVTLHERNDPALSLAAAYEDGIGAWTPITSASGVFRFTVTSPTWSFAWGCGETFSDGEWRSNLTMLAFSTEERATYDAVANCPQLAGTTVVSGTMTNAGPTSTGLYVFAYGSDQGNGVTQQASSVKFSLGVFEAGTHDLYGGLGTYVQGSGTSMTKVAVARNVTAPTATAALDLGAALPTTAPLAVTIASPGANYTAAYTSLADASGTWFRVTDSSSGPPHVTYGLAASQLQSGDEYLQSAKAQRCDDAFRCDGVEQQRWTRVPAVQTLALSPGLGAVATAGSGHELSASWPAVGGAVGYTWVATQGRSVFRGVIGTGFATVRGPGFALPDPGGFTWFLPDGLSTITGSVTAVMSSLGAADLPLQARPPAGTERTLASSYLERGPT